MLTPTLDTYVVSKNTIHVRNAATAGGWWCAWHGIRLVDAGPGLPRLYIGVAVLSAT